ncbi:MAG: hypothetical protein H7326_08165 [Bdellovibrionaceae bacterium]|nr:hypothetical protein [Pseudobdellovibrionaceae bacterium]
MKNGYDQFFQKARKAASTGQSAQRPARQQTQANSRFEVSEEALERQLKMRMGMPTQAAKRKKNKKGIPWKLVATSLLGILATAYGIENHEQVEKLLKRVEISYLGSASAAEVKPKKEAATKSEKTEGGKKAEGTIPGGTDVAKAEAGEAKPGSADEQIDHLSRLTERKKELDDREEELNHMDQELQAQKSELDKRMKELEDVRRGISSVLEDKVKVDDKKVDTLVLMYSDMKAPQAAKVFETMDEDLAVEILGRMKKKNAADIMNLLKPEKAQVLSEKFAGYKRK